MNTVAIIQARMGSTRFPNKVMRLINKVPLIELLLRRVAQSKKIDRVILATSENANNQILVKHTKKLGFETYQGSEDDVLDRYYQAALNSGAKNIIRITGDCPLIDPKVIDDTIDLFFAKKVDYACNTDPPTFPDGLDVEIFSFSALRQAWQEAKRRDDREHVTTYIRESGLFKKTNLRAPIDMSSQRWTVDEPEDFEVVQNIFDHFHPRWNFEYDEIMKLTSDYPEMFQANQKFYRNEGRMNGLGQKLWSRAKRIIPGGNMLLSKRPEMFLPKHWPAYFSKASGCKVWDMEGIEYTDMSIMGIGTNILGYGHPEVDESVHKVVQKGNMSTFNCPEEVYLAERLVELHPWAKMVRFARSGGEANAIAIRIARASVEKQKVAICGYHGWHDWYLAANLGDQSNLDGHLLPGLDPKGVPDDLKGTTLTFSYNDFDSLQRLVREHDIGIIKMEVSRSKEPQDDFLCAVRQLATENKIILIFDECTSGFRETFGGLHKKYCVEPDLAVFGKAMGNGYAITSVIGRKSIMEASQKTFISSTFWTERIGPTAALKTLEVMEREKAWQTITAIGESIGKGWKDLAEKYQLPLEINGLKALVNFRIPVQNWIKYKTLITQEMLKKGFLAGNSVYVCTKHSKQIVDDYFEKLDPVFSTIADCENGKDVNALLNGPVCHEGFKRLN